MGVYTSAADEEQMNDFVLPELDKLGIQDVETGIMDTPVSDVTAVEANVNVIAEKFKSAGVDTVLIVGIAGANWPLSMADNPYSPHLLFPTSHRPRLRHNAVTTDTSILRRLADRRRLRPGPGPLRRADDAGVHQDVEGRRCRHPDTGGRRARPVRPAVPGGLPGLPDVVDRSRPWLDAAGRT